MRNSLIVAARTVLFINIIIQAGAVYKEVCDVEVFINLRGANLCVV